MKKIIFISLILVVVFNLIGCLSPNIPDNDENKVEKLILDNSISISIPNPHGKLNKNGEIADSEVLISGGKQLIEWRNKGKEKVFDIILLKNGRYVDLIAESVKGNKYQWSIPNTFGEEYQVAVIPHKEKPSKKDKSSTIAGKIRGGQTGDIIIIQSAVIMARNLVMSAHRRDKKEIQDELFVFYTREFIQRNIDYLNSVNGNSNGYLSRQHDEFDPDIVLNRPPIIPVELFNLDPVLAHEVAAAYDNSDGDVVSFLLNLTYTSLNSDTGINMIDHILQTQFGYTQQEGSTVDNMTWVDSNSTINIKRSYSTAQHEHYDLKTIDISLKYVNNKTDYKFNLDIEFTPMTPQFTQFDIYKSLQCQIIKEVRMTDSLGNKKGWDVLSDWIYDYKEQRWKRYSAQFIEK